MKRLERTIEFAQETTCSRRASTADRPRDGRGLAPERMERAPEDRARGDSGYPALSWSSGPATIKDGRHAATGTLTSCFASAGLVSSRPARSPAAAAGAPSFRGNCGISATSTARRPSTPARSTEHVTGRRSSTVSSDGGGQGTGARAPRACGEGGGGMASKKRAIADRQPSQEISSVPQKKSDGELTAAVERFLAGGDCESGR